MKDLIKQAFELGKEAAKMGQSLVPNDNSKLLEIMPDGSLYDPRPFRARIKLYDAYIKGCRSYSESNHAI